MNNHCLISYRVVLVWVFLAFTFIGTASAQTTSFVYQGRLTDNGGPASGQYDFECKLFDNANAGTGTQQGSTITVSNVTVTAGVFTIELDFGAAVFPGAARFLEIAVKKVTDSNFTTLTPRQPIAANPYAIHTLSADALSPACTNCVTSTQIQSIDGSKLTGSINGSQIGGTIPVASVPAGSANYIQNSASQQSGASFNVSGSGTANILNATTQFNLGGNRILSNAGTDNLFAGIGAGTSNTTGTTNSFFGINAGQANTTGGGHSFFGAGAGRVNNAFCCNSFFGREAGKSNTTGTSNSFFGDSAGGDNSTGMFNSFFGHNTGQRNTTSTSNSFFGESAGNQNTTGAGNAFFGASAGFATTTGNSNSIFGTGAGTTNTTGSNITLVGANTSVGANNLTFATAVGAQSVVSTSNTIVLGRNLETVRIPGVLTVAGSIDADSMNVTTQYKIAGNRILSNAGAQNLFVGVGAGAANTGFSNTFFGFNAGFGNGSGSQNAFFGNIAGGNSSADNNSFFGSGAGLNNTTGSTNTFFGQNAGILSTTGNNNIFIGPSTGPANLATQVNNSIAIGFGVKVAASNSIVLGSPAETTSIPGKLLMGGGPMMTGNFVAQSFSSSPFSGIFTGNLVLDSNLLNNVLPSPVHLCIRTTSLGGGFGGEMLSRCTTTASASSFKTELQPFAGGLDVINRLKPMTFTWKEAGTRDVGLSADDVAEVEPLLVTRNDKGQPEDVKEGSLNVLFINAFKEQQKQIEQQRQQLEALKKLVCQSKPEADVCKSK